MLSILYSDLRKSLNSRTVKLGFAVSAGVPVFAYVLYRIIYKLAGFNSPVYGDSALLGYQCIAIFEVAAVITAIFTSDFNDGIIRNKIASGATRTSVLVSGVLTSVIISLTFTIASALVAYLVTALLTPGFETFTWVEATDYILAMTISESAIAVVSAVILFCLEGKKIAVTIPLGLAFLSYIFSSIVMEKLYPQNSVCTLTGLRLTVFTLYDRYCPYAHLVGTMRWNFGSYVIGSGIFVIVFMVLGLLIFNKKDLI